MQISDWGDLQFVQAIAEAGTLAAAASRLGVNQSTVFRRLGALEERLGAALFERSRQGYAPTPAGQEAIEAAHAISERIDGLERHLLGRDAQPSGPLRITTTDTLLFPVLAPIVADFVAAYPGIVPELVTDNAFLNLTRREADVALRPSRNPGDHLVGRRIAGLTLAVYGARDMARQAGEAESLGDLPWVMLDEAMAQLPIARWLARKHPQAHIACRANSLLALRDLAMTGMGITLLPCYLGDAEDTLTRLSAPLEPLESDLWLLTHPDLRHNARVRVFMDFASAALVAMRPRFEAR